MLDSNKSKNNHPIIETIANKILWDNSFVYSERKRWEIYRQINHTRKVLKKCAIAGKKPTHYDTQLIGSDFFPLWIVPNNWCEVINNLIFRYCCRCFYPFFSINSTYRDSFIKINQFSFPPCRKITAPTAETNGKTTKYRRFRNCFGRLASNITPKSKPINTR